MRASRDGSHDIGINGAGSSFGSPVLLAECFADIRRAHENAREECEANAHLIAAAPDLLEALRDVVIARIEHLDPMSYYDAMDRVAERAQAAIAKAEGRS